MDLLADRYDVVEIFGRKALLSNGRVNRADLPDDIHAYDIRHGDDDSIACTLELFVGVNHFSTVLCVTDYGLEKDSYIEFDNDTSPNFLGYEATITEYLAEWTDSSDPLPKVIRVAATVPVSTPINVPYVSVWDGGTEIETSADIDIKTGEITNIVTSECYRRLDFCERQYIIMNGSQVDVYENEHGFDYWADISGIYNN